MFRYYFIAAGFLIAVGFTPIPLVNAILSLKEEWLLFWVPGAISASALLPFTIALLSGLLRTPLNKTIATSLAIAVGITGIFLSLLNTGLSGAGASLSLIHGLSLTLAITASILLLSVPMRPSTFKTAPALVLIVPLGVALWSLASVVAIARNAEHLSDGEPFCIASHDGKSVAQSFAHLRGLSFYTTASGYKSTSRWYFHGLLIVEAQSGNEIYNWSPRRMTFQRVEHPERFIANLMNACVPREDYWKTLSVL